MECKNQIGYFRHFLNLIRDGQTSVWPPPHNQIYSRFWYAFSLSLSEFHSVNPFNGNFCEPGRAQFAEEKMEFSVSGCQQNVFYSIFSQIQTVFEPVQGPGTVNVRNEPVHDMACVEKYETPPVLRWKLWKFQHRKSISESGINVEGVSGDVCTVILKRFDFCILDTVWSPNIAWFLQKMANCDVQTCS